MNADSPAADPAFWLQRWRAGDTGWHKPETNELLTRHWPNMRVAAGATVLVPLCGASLDMAWLADQSHAILGIDVSSLALNRFFETQALTPAEGSGGLTAGPYTLIAADIFGPTVDHLPDFAAIYDRAALIALPPSQRPAYAGRLTTWSRPGTIALLIAIDYPQRDMDGPPFSVPDREVRALFGDAWRIDILADLDVLASSPQLRARGVTALRERAYRLTRLPDAPDRRA